MVFPTLVDRAVLALRGLASKASSLGENRREANQQFAISRNAQASTAVLVPSARWLKQLDLPVPRLQVEGNALQEAYNRNLMLSTQGKT